MFKNVWILLVLVCFSLGCREKDPPAELAEDIVLINTNRQLSPKIQTLLDSSLVKGSILIYNARKDQFISNDYTWAEKGFLPASTYKVPHSIIALETEVVQSDSAIMVWDGVRRNYEVWNQDLKFKDAFKYSCVPCYQDVAKKIGVKRMKANLTKLGFGKMIFDEPTIDQFWLNGESRIAQFEQIDFLRRFKSGSLPISKRTYDLVNQMMILEQNDQYTLKGKTGWTSNNRLNNGWFIGILEQQDNIYYFATNVEPADDFDLSDFPRIRKYLTIQAFKKLEIL